MSEYLRRKVERSNARTDSQRDPPSVCVHIFADFELVAKHVSGNTACSLYHLEASQHITMRIINCLSLFKNNAIS